MLDRETRAVRAAEAVALFCCQVKKCIGAFAAALEGLDARMFASGIGLNAPKVRARSCDGCKVIGCEPVRFYLTNEVKKGHAKGGYFYADP